MNKKYNFVILGAQIAGTTAAETIRENDKNSSIALFGLEKYPLYSRVLLPNFLKNRLNSIDDVFLRKNEDYSKKGIDLFLEKEAVFIDFEKKRVDFSDGLSVFYDKLIIASGGRVKKYQIENVSENDIYQFQTLDDAKKIKNAILSSKEAVVVGGSFIALELLESFYLNRIKSSLIVRGSCFFGGGADFGASNFIVNNLKKHNIDVYCCDEPKKGEINDNKKYLVTKNNFKIKYDIIGAGIGIERNLDFVKDRNLIKINKGILVDEFLATSIEDVFACGDVSEYFDLFTESYQLCGNWPTAVMQGKIAGLNAVFGKKYSFKHFGGYNIINFGLNISFFGFPESKSDKKLVRSNLDKNQYAVLYLKDNRLIGAFQINMNKERNLLMKIMEQKIDLSNFEDNIKDVNFDLSLLLNR